MCTMSEEPVRAILKRGRIFEVGGAVRDRYLSHGQVVKDRDYLVTGVTYDELTSILRDYGRVDLVGRSFGVIKFTQQRKGKTHTFDISLPRKEHSTGPGHTDFAVDFDPAIPVEQDLLRRDFTINAMALALDNDELIDPLQGLADLKNRRLRMTSPDSFPEDPLRMLRAIQFAARFQFDIEPATFQALQQHAAFIASVSAERISEELTKLLVHAERPSDGFRVMHTSTLLGHILPELEACVEVTQPGPYHKYDVFEHTIRTVDACPQSLRLRLAALFHDIRKPQARRLTETGATFYGHEITGARAAVTAMNRLRYPRELAQQVATLVERHMYTTPVTEKGLRRLIRRVGVDLIFELLDLRRADVVAQGMGGSTVDVDELEAAIREELSHKPPLGVGDLALDGRDIMALLGVDPGPVVGQVLDYLLEKVLDQPQDNTREQLETYAKEYHQTLTSGRLPDGGKDIDA
ncbi:MAG: HD domain-containing protein [Candidatus Zixiibacteriota bacterium]